MAKHARASVRWSRTKKSRQETAQSSSNIGLVVNSVGETESDLVARLRRAVLDELTVVESLQERLKNEPHSRVAAERTARTLSTLTDTLQKLQRRQCTLPETERKDDDDMPADIDEFRNELARRIRAFVESRAERNAVDGVGTSPLDPVRS